MKTNNELETDPAILPSMQSVRIDISFPALELN